MTTLPVVIATANMVDIITAIVGICVAGIINGTKNTDAETYQPHKPEQPACIFFRLRAAVVRSPWARSKT